MQRRQLPAGWDKDLPPYPADPKGAAGRDVSGKVLNALAKNVPWLLGGSADLAPSTKTRLTFEGAGDFTAHDYGGRNFHFGIREHAMGAVLNGLALSKVRAYGSGFLIFSDYCGRRSASAPSWRSRSSTSSPTTRSAWARTAPPTSRSSSCASLRAIPGLITLRPGDANEVVEAWKLIMQLKHEPVALILSRQAMPTLDRTKYAPAAGLAKGAYVLADAPGGKPDVILMATGSEVGLCRERVRGAGQGRREGPRGQHAVVGAVRAPGPGVSRQRAPAIGDLARGYRAGLDASAGTGTSDSPARPSP